MKIWQAKPISLFAERKLKGKTSKLLIHWRLVPWYYHYGIENGISAECYSALDRSTKLNLAAQRSRVQLCTLVLWSASEHGRPLCEFPARTLLLDKLWNWGYTKWLSEPPKCWFITTPWSLNNSFDERIEFDGTNKKEFEFQPEMANLLKGKDAKSRI